LAITRLKLLWRYVQTNSNTLKLLCDTVQVRISDKRGVNELLD